MGFAHTARECVGDRCCGEIVGATVSGSLAAESFSWRPINGRCLQT